MTQVYVSVGSNQQARKYVPKALDLIRASFAPIDLSRVYESVAVGFDGENFLNLVVGFETDLSLQELAETLNNIEQACGRKRGEARFMPRTMDLDLLIYGNLIRHDDGFDLPRDEILRFAFVLKPLAELAPGGVHPEEKVTFLHLWEIAGEKGTFSEQELWEIEL